jgi:hypothetical protein
MATTSSDKGKAGITIQPAIPVVAPAPAAPVAAKPVVYNAKNQPVSITQYSALGTTVGQTAAKTVGALTFKPTARGWIQTDNPAAPGYLAPAPATAALVNAQIANPKQPLAAPVTPTPATTPTPTPTPATAAPVAGPVAPTPVAPAPVTPAVTAAQTALTTAQNNLNNFVKTNGSTGATSMAIDQLQNAVNAAQVGLTTAQQQALQPAVPVSTPVAAPVAPAAATPAVAPTPIKMPTSAVSGPQVVSARSLMDQQIAAADAANRAAVAQGYASAADMQQKQAQAAQEAADAQAAATAQATESAAAQQAAAADTAAQTAGYQNAADQQTQQAAAQAAADAAAAQAAQAAAAKKVSTDAITAAKLPAITAKTQGVQVGADGLKYMATADGWRQYSNPSAPNYLPLTQLADAANQRVVQSNQQSAAQAQADAQAKADALAKQQADVAAQNQAAAAQKAAADKAAADALAKQQTQVAAANAAAQAQREADARAAADQLAQQQAQVQAQNAAAQAQREADARAAADALAQQQAQVQAQNAADAAARQEAAAAAKVTADQAQAARDLEAAKTVGGVAPVAPLTQEQYAQQQAAKYAAMAQQQAGVQAANKANSGGIAEQAGRAFVKFADKNIPGGVKTLMTLYSLYNLDWQAIGDTVHNLTSGMGQSEVARNLQDVYGVDPTTAYNITSKAEDLVNAGGATAEDLTQAGYDASTVNDAVNFDVVNAPPAPVAPDILDTTNNVYGGPVAPPADMISNPLPDTSQVLQPDNTIFSQPAAPTVDTSNMIPVTPDAAGNPQFLNPQTGDIVNASGDVVSAMPQPGPAQPPTAAVETPYRVDVSGTAGFADNPNSVINQYRSPNTDLATLDQINSGQAVYNNAANAWEVPGAPAAGPVAPVETAIDTTTSSYAPGGSRYVAPVTAGEIPSLPEAVASAPPGLSPTDLALLGGGAAVIGAISGGGGGAAAAAPTAPAPVQPAPTAPAPVQTAPAPVQTAPAPVAETPVQPAPAPAPVQPAPVPATPPAETPVQPAPAPEPTPAPPDTRPPVVDRAPDYVNPNPTPDPTLGEAIRGLPITGSLLTAAQIAAGWTIINGIATPPPSKWAGYGPLDYRWNPSAGTPVNGPGLNPGLIGQVQPFYHTTSPVQSQFYWGQHPYMATEADLANYNNIPSAPAVPFGIQTERAPFDVAQFIRQNINPQTLAAAQGANPAVGPVAPY